MTIAVDWDVKHQTKQTNKCPAVIRIFVIESQLYFIMVSDMYLMTAMNHIILLSRFIKRIACYPYVFRYVAKDYYESCPSNRKIHVI